jgi:hypothetical protein
LLIVLGAAGFVFQWWKGHAGREHHGARAIAMTQSTDGRQASANGFIDAAMPDGAKPGTVLVFAPVNCPSEAAQRADALAEQLTRLGIPTVRSSSYSASVTSPSAEQRERVERAVSVIQGEIPAVFINGMAKANPSVDEVVAEYERTR